MKNNIVVFAIALSLSSCLSFKPVSADRVERATINSISQDGIDADLYITVNNPNRFAIKVKQIELSIASGNIPLGRVLITDKISIPARSKTEQRLHIKSAFSNMTLATIPTLLGMLGSKKVNINAVGEVKAGVLLVNKKFKVQFNSDVKL